jgi:uncharacterized protein YcaQ
VTRRHLERVIDRTGVLQIDSVNVLARAHYLPLFSRLGPYPTGLLDTAAGFSVKGARATPGSASARRLSERRLVFEYWTHVAALTPVRLHPFLRWRMAEAHLNAWPAVRRIARDAPDLVRWVRDEVAARGPVAAAEIEQDLPRPAKIDWGWNWSDVKIVLEWLFLTGEVAVAGRTNGFARLYDTPERVLPRAVLDAPTPSEDEAFRELVGIAARALGVAAEPELRDYFRLRGPRFTRALAALVEEGTLVPVGVAGWKPRAYLHADARVPRRVDAATLVSPFDPLVWERSRTQRLFDFHYRIGIYTVPSQRVHGYYALPILLGDTLVGRVDLQADRQAGVLLVPGAWAEPGHDLGIVAERLWPVLEDVARWLGLAAVAPAQAGDLAATLSRTRGGHRSVTVVP